jgi:triphosphatase
VRALPPADMLVSESPYRESRTFEKSNPDGNPFMSGRHRIQIRLVTGGDRLDALLGDPLFGGSTDVFNHVSSRYFDSGGWNLHKSSASLETRIGAGLREQTLAIDPQDDAQPLVRVEWTSRIRKAAPDLDALPADARARVGRMLGEARLHSFASVVSERARRTLRYDEATIEAISDRAVIAAAGHREDCCELLLELSEGAPADLFHFVLDLPLGPDLRWSTVSRAERGYWRAAGVPGMASKATPVRLNEKSSAPQAFQRIAWHCLGQLLRNYEMVIAHSDADALHQSRVALRRLRAAFSIFAEVIADDASVRLRAEFKAVADVLGSARDLDVLIGALGSQEVPADIEQRDVDELLLQLDGQRSLAYGNASALLQGVSFQTLLFRTAAWIEGGDWLKRASGDGAVARLIPFSSAIMRSRRRQLEKKARDLAALGPKARHRLRIRVKKLRYATDFFASVFSSHRSALRQKAFSSALETLQDRLGELNDMVAGWNPAALDLASVDDIRRAGLRVVLERMLAARAGSEQPLLKAAQKASNEALLVRRFWKKMKRQP